MKKLLFDKCLILRDKIDIMQVTIFKDIKDTSTPFHVDVQKILSRIKTGASKELVKKIRTERNKPERDAIKRELPAICFSGVFSRRADAALVKHSGLICLDFDGYTKSKLMLEDKEMFTKDKYVFSVFVSPSGNGLKVLVKIPPEAENHVHYFNSLRDYYDSEYFDKVNKNISRVCFESYDPLIHINPNSSIWDIIAEPEYVEYSKEDGYKTIPITDENKLVSILTRWWEKKYPMVAGVRNENTFVLAAAMNDFGINKSLAMYVLRAYTAPDFGETEIKQTVDSAYADTSKHGSKSYEDEEKVSSIRAKILRGVPKKEIRLQMEESDIDSEVIDSLLTRLEAEHSKAVFWKKSDKGVVKIDHLLFKTFLEDNGFYKYCPENSKNYIFVKVTNNLVDHASEKEIKDFVLDHLLSMDDISVYNYFADNTRFFRDEFLSMIGTIDIYFISDTKDSAYLYYRNCAVMVTKGKVVPIDYMDLGGYVWSDHVIPRNFKICKVKDLCNYPTFIRNICANNDTRVDAMETTIGFMLHGHKNLSYCPAVILNDEVISDNPEGGTGKGIFMNALGHMKKMVVIDGKSFQVEKSFAYQLVSADTQILCFDDAKRHFDFERLFSVVTEGLTLEKKNKDAIKIPFSRSPKIAITTNYAIKGAGNSFARRKWELELYQYYSKDFTPQDEFGKLLFGDWNDEEWCEFDNYMIKCLQKYLSNGLMESKFVNLSARKLSAETSHEFIEWVGLVDGYEKDSCPIEVGNRYQKNELYDAFIKEYPDYAPRSKMTISRTKFYKWLSAYAIFKTGMYPEEGRDVIGRWMRLRGTIN